MRLIIGFGLKILIGDILTIRRWWLGWLLLFVTFSNMYFVFDLCLFFLLIFFKSYSLKLLKMRLIIGFGLKIWIGDILTIRRWWLGGLQLVMKFSKMNWAFD